MRKLSLSIPPAVRRQGVPATLAARYVTRTARPRKGRGAYSRKGRKALAD